MAGWAAVLALAAIRLVWPLFRALIGIDLEFRAVWNAEILALTGLTALATGFLAGLYPAAGLARLRPVRAFREFSRSGRKGAALRSVLVVFQFGASIVLIVGTIVIGRQMRYVQTRDPGYVRERVVTLPLRRPETRAQAAGLREDVRMDPNVIDAAVSGRLPTVFCGPVRFSLATESGEAVEMRCVHVPIDERFIDLYAIRIVEGRNFRPLEAGSALINETLVRAMGWTRPLGKTIQLQGRIKMTVVGVVRDFHFASLHAPIGPLILASAKRGGGEYLSVKIHPGDFAKAQAGLKRAYEGRIKGEPFEARFLDEIFDGLYKKEMRTGTFVLVFAFLAVWIQKGTIFLSHCHWMDSAK